MQKLSFGPVMIDINGLFLSKLEAEKIAHPNTGAVILFARNYENRQQIKKLIGQIRAARNGTVLIAVDQEGGRVQRFQNDFTALPAASCYQQRPLLSETGGWLMASELLEVGVDFSFAPVLDVDSGISTVIGDRSFSHKPHFAASLASYFRHGMQQAGMAATGKHFPGHGAVALDSHLALPTDARPFDEILQKDLHPFQQLIAQGLEAIMPAHIVYPQVDSLPAGFSRIWLDDILRKQLHFDGAIFSDDLSMEGASIMGDFAERARCALDAGCDMVLVCNNPSEAEYVLDAIACNKNQQRQDRLQTMQGRPVKQSQYMRLRAVAALSTIGNN